MARVVHLTTIVIVVLASAVSKRRTFLHYSNYLKKSQPHHWKYDQEELGRRVEQIARGHQVRAQLQPLHPHDAVPWHQWTRAARLAALNDVRNREINQVRTQLLQQKLSLKPPARQPLVLPQVKPKIRVVAKNPRHKGDLQEPNRRIRTKREIQINPQLLPEVVKQSHNQPAMTRHTKIQNVRSSLGLHFYNPSIYYPEVIEALTNRTDPYQEQVKRNSGKRQILYWVKPVQQLRAVATTPDPNNFETEKQEPGEQKSPDLHSSYQLSETSDLEYESGYTISMSDSEDWENYPLTTAAGPNPGWRLSTLADIYQKPKQTHSVGDPIPNTRLISRFRVKRSPKQKLRKIGARKEKLKQRRKVKDMKRKRRIIRNSKEDKEVKEVIDEQRIENLLKRPNPQQRRATYREVQPSQEILWSNDTHRIVEDKGTHFEWINKTHYRIYKENVTNDWYSKHHVLVADKEYWANKTRQDIYEEKKERKKKVAEKKDEEEYSEDYDEEFTQEEEEEMRQNIRGRQRDKKKEEAVKKIAKQGKKSKEKVDKRIEQEQQNIESGENESKRGKKEDIKRKEDKVKKGHKIEKQKSKIDKKTVKERIKESDEKKSKVDEEELERGELDDIQGKEEENEEKHINQVQKTPPKKYDKELDYSKENLDRNGKEMGKQNEEVRKIKDRKQKTDKKAETKITKTITERVIEKSKDKKSDPEKTEEEQNKGKKESSDKELEEESKSYIDAGLGWEEQIVDYSESGGGKQKNKNGKKDNTKKNNADEDLKKFNQGVKKSVKKATKKKDLKKKTGKKSSKKATGKKGPKKKNKG